MVADRLIGTENRLNLCFLWKQNIAVWIPRYPIEREYKMGVLGETTSFMALLWCAPHFMQDRKSPKITISLLIP